MRRSRLISGLACCVLAASVFVLDAAAQNHTRLDGRLVQGGTGLPVSGASVSIVGMSGSARTDSDGRFTWVPAPPVPFQVIVIAPSGQMASPVIVDAVQGGTALIQVRPLAVSSH